MSMPNANTEWPPAPWATAWRGMEDRHTWWEGDPGKVAALMERNRPKPHTRRSQYNGGILGAAARSVFGTPPPPTSKIVHVPIASDLATTSAQLMASDPPRFVIGDDAGNDAARHRLDRIVNSPDFHPGLLEGEELAAALGDTYARISWDAELRDEPWIEFVDGDHAWPTYRKGILVGVTFWEELPGSKRDEVYRHLEHHGVGYIEHALFKGKSDNLGMRVPLPDHEATATIPVDAESRIETGTIELTACHIPNVSPNPLFRTTPALRRLGKPDLTPAVMGLMGDVNDAFSGLARDIRLGKARILLSEHLTHTAGPGTGGVFDVDQEAFAMVGGMPSEAPIIEAQQFQIRVTEHMQAAESYIRQILTSVGYSPMQFGLKDDATSSMTATEIEAKDRGSAATKTAKSLRRRAALSRLAKALIEVDAFVFGTGAELNEPVSVEYQPAVTPTTESLSNTLNSLRAARAASTLTLVGMLHPDWDKADIEAEVDRILDEEKGDSLFDPFNVPDDHAFTPERDPDEPADVEEAKSEG